jgi:hypothetical protein
LAGAPSGIHDARMNAFIRALPFALVVAPALAGDTTLTGQGSAWLAAKWAGRDLAAIAATARAYRDQNGSWPSDCLATARAALQPAPQLDPWGAPYACEVKDGKLLVIAPGADGRAGTADDVVLDAESNEAKAMPEPTPEPTPAPAPAATATAAAGVAQAMPETAAPAGAKPASAESLATARKLRDLADALESFRKKEGHYPVADRIEHLQRWLVSEHLAEAAWSAQDAWGRPFRYRTTDVGSSYTLASAGADGRWEALTPDQPSSGDDIAIADGRVVHGPATPTPAATVASSASQPGASGSPQAEASASADSAAHRAEPRDPHALTRSRLDDFAARLARHAADGRFPQSDDAERLARDLGMRASSDGWGRALHYLSVSSGSHFALVSAGPDGKLGRDMEAYAHGAAAAGDDVILQK